MTEASKKPKQPQAPIQSVRALLAQATEKLTAMLRPLGRNETDEALDLAQDAIALIRAADKRVSDLGVTLAQLQAAMDKIVETVDAQLAAVDAKIKAREAR